MLWGITPERHVSFEHPSEADPLRFPSGSHLTAVAQWLYCHKYLRMGQVWSNMMGKEHNEQLSCFQLLDTPGDSPAVSESRQVPNHRVVLPLHIYCIILCDQLKHFNKFKFFAPRFAKHLDYHICKQWGGMAEGMATIAHPSITSKVALGYHKHVNICKHSRMINPSWHYHHTHLLIVSCQGLALDSKQKPVASS